MTITDAATLPPDIKTKLLEIRDHLVKVDIDAAYTALYSIADPGFLSHYPWQSLEQCEFYPGPDDGCVCGAGSDIAGPFFCTNEYSESCQWAKNLRGLESVDELHKDDLNVD